MPRFIQFESAEPNHTGEPIYINPDEVAALKPSGTGTLVISSGGSLLVQESRDEALKKMGARGTFEFVELPTPPKPAKKGFFGMRR